MADKLYTNCDIPAKLFFKVINTGDYSLLGKGTKEQQEKAFWSILDEYVTIDNNKAVIDAYSKQARANVMKLQITHLETLLMHLFTFKHLLKRSDIEKLVEMINGIDGVRANFDINKPIELEIERVQLRVIGAMRNQMNIDNMDARDGKKQAEVNFYSQLAYVAKALAPMSFSEEISLYLFVEFKKMAKEQSKALKNGK